MTKERRNLIKTQRLEDVMPKLPTSFFGMFFESSVPSDQNIEVSIKLKIT